MANSRREIDPNKCLTYLVPEAGEMLGLTRNASYAAAKRGDIPTIRLGKLIRSPEGGVRPTACSCGYEVSTRETADDYAKVVVMLSEDWRIIECRDGIQWILQHRGSPKKPRKDDWRGRSYCRTSEALIRCARLHAGPIDASARAVLTTLPKSFHEHNQSESSHDELHSHPVPAGSAT